MSDQGLGKPQSLFHAARITADTPAACVREPEYTKEVRCPFLRLSAFHAEQFPHHDEVFLASHPTWKRHLLRHIADNRAAVGMSLDTIEPDRTGARTKQSGEYIQCRCFAGAIRPEQGGAAPLVDRERDVLDGVDRAE